MSPKELTDFLEDKYKKWKPKGKPKDSLTRLITRIQFNVNVVTSEADVKIISEMENFSYTNDEKAEDVFPFTRLLEWWKKFGDGIQGLYLEGKLVGAISLWPIAEEQAKQFKSGKIKETKLEPLPLNKKITKSLFNNNRIKQYWYIGAIVVKKDLRSDLNVLPTKELIVGSYYYWSDNYFEYPCELIAVGYTTEGNNMLKSNVFTHHEVKGKDGKDIYSCGIDNFNDLEQSIIRRWDETM